MHLSRIRIENFRNFSDFDLTLGGNVVVVGENRVGKSNLLYALRLIFDPTLPDSARQLSLSDFWDGRYHDARGAMRGQLRTGVSVQPMVVGAIYFLMAIGSMLRPRWLPQKSFPPYAYLPGKRAMEETG